MSPKKLQTKTADSGYARGRARIAAKYLEAAELMATDDDPSAGNVCIGTAVLAGIAAGDAICAAATGERYSGHDHDAAAALLRRVDREAGDRLKALVGLKPSAHYGERILSERDAKAALRDATWLVTAARTRVS